MTDSDITLEASILKKFQAEVDSALKSGDKLEPVADIIERESGERVHPVSIVRWCQRGKAGLILPSIKVNKRRLTTVEAWFCWEQTVARVKSLRGIA